MALEQRETATLVNKPNWPDCDNWAEPVAASNDQSGAPVSVHLSSGPGATPDFNGIVALHSIKLGFRRRHRPAPLSVDLAGVHHANNTVALWARFKIQASVAWPLKDRLGRRLLGRIYRQARRQAAYAPRCHLFAQLSSLAPPTRTTHATRPPLLGALACTCGNYNNRQRACAWLDAGTMPAKLL